MHRNQIIRITTTKEIVGRVIEAEDLATNIDATAIGFNAAKVGGKEPGAASGLATLDASSKVVQKPADRLSKANLEIATDKLLKGAGTGVNPTEIDIPAGGDMYKSTYDTDGGGIVDNSEKLGGSTKAQVQDHTPKSHTLASHSTKAHSELTGIGASDHHSKYTNAEAQSTVKANVEVGDLKAPTKALPMNSQKITGLAAPTASADAARKTEVDTVNGKLDDISQAQPIRELDGIYQNGAKIRVVTVTLNLGPTEYARGFVGSSSPNIAIAYFRNDNTSAIIVPGTFIVLPNYYYKIEIVGGAPTINYWVEWDLH